MKTWHIGKLAAAAVAASLALFAPMAGASSASAETIPQIGDPAVASHGERGLTVRLDRPNGSANLRTQVFEIKVNGKTYRSYCIEGDKVFREGQGSVAEWNDLEETKKNQVGWILENSYPKIGVEELSAAAGVEGLTKGEAIAATQAAIWHFTEKSTSINTDASQWSNPTAAAKILKAYEYLVGDANVGVNFSDNKASVELKLEGDKIYKPGDKVGPITVTSSQDLVKLAAVPDNSDYEIVDKDGNPVDLNAVKPGELFVKIKDTASDGNLSLTATSSANSLTGRLFVHAAGKYQRVVLIDSETDVKQAEVTIQWKKEETPPVETPPAEETPTESESTPPAAETPAPGGKGGGNGSDSLATTGAESSGTLVAAAAALIAAGAATVFAVRRKQSH